MKVQGNQIPPQILPQDREAPRRTSGSGQATSPEPAARLEGGFLAALEGAQAPVRRDLVDEVRASIAAGTFERSVDLDVVVDALLAEL